MIHHQPAKYHTNPLTHFLNLHSSHATAAAAAAAAAAALDQHGHHQNYHPHGQQNQHLQHPHLPAKLSEDLNLLNNNNNNNNDVAMDVGIGLDDDCDKSQDRVGVDIENTDTNASSDAENNNIDILDDDDDDEGGGCEDEDEDRNIDCEDDESARQDNHTPSTTPLDPDGIGKSFTIAAILGLKKKQNAAEAHNFSDVMNLSLNNSSNNNNVHGADSGESAFQQRGASESPAHLGGHLVGGMSAASQAANSLAAMQQTLHHIHGTAAGFAGHQFHPHVPHHQQGAVHLGSQHPQQQQQQQPPPSQSHPHNHYHHHYHPHNHHNHHHLAMAAHHHAQNHNRDKFKDLSKKSSLSSSAALKSKRVRTIFTPEQLERLEAEFERQQYMVGPERLYLAHTLQLTEAQVKVWFQNRRIKWRKHHLEITQQRLALIRQRQIANGAVIPNQPAAVTSPGGDGAITPSQSQQPSQQPMMAGNRLMLGGTESPELTICTDSLEARSVSESDD